MPNHQRYYATLDLIRGVAAIFVVVYHLQHWLTGPGYAVNAGLAVDLFFCLSGFVLAGAYVKRFAAGMTLRSFIISRMIRLMPLVFVATVISGTYVWARVIQGSDTSTGFQVITAIMLNLLSIPFFDAPSAIGGPQLFPLNGPQYTIFLEIIVNISWYFTSKIECPMLNYVVVGISLIFIVILGIGGDTSGTFSCGLSRVFYSFYVGIILFTIFNKTGRGAATLIDKSLFAVCFALMVLIFALPLPYMLTWTGELMWIAVFSPALVFVAARVRIEGRLTSISVWLGAISYPVYILHYPLFCWINGAYQYIFEAKNFMVEAGLLMLSLALLSQIILKLFDSPIRSLLTRTYRHVK
ncbi:acyltransferase [Methylobacterium sp. WL18]|uniref:acyltransferase family protein n=1 Tax=Methylobacterium sp. WL18 TaxID=2603897 RepID=UPI00164EF45A|nr:acyltransferase [Methylobacterium sp. WL18]